MLHFEQIFLKVFSLLLPSCRCLYEIGENLHNFYIETFVYAITSMEKLV